MIDSLLQDVRYAVRSLRHRPIVAAAVVASLALGIGINTAIFSVFERLMLRRLPVPAADELVLLSSPGPRPGGTSTGDSGPREQTFSYPLFRDLERLRGPHVPRLAAHRDFAANVSFDAQRTRQSGLLVSGGYFAALRLQPALGRLLTEDDDREGAAPVAVLTYRYWTTAFAANPAAVGRSIVINGTSTTVVGVAPDGFNGTTVMDTVHLFVPLAMTAALHVGSRERDNHWLYLFARLAPGTTRAQATTALNAPFAALMRDVELPALRTKLADTTRAQFLSRRLRLEDGARYRANRGEAQVVLGLLLAVTGLVLLVACANVSNLLLARGVERATDIGIRLSLGASAARLFRMLLVESTVLGIVGAACAMAVAWMVTTAVLGLLPATDGAVLGFEVNRTVLLFTGALGLTASVIFGLLPAWHGVRIPALSGWNAAGRSSAPRRTMRLRAALLAAQIALATALVAQAGLFTVSLTRLTREALGFQRDGVVTFRLSPYLNGYTQADARSLFDAVTGALRRAPGVRAAGASTNPILSDSAWTQGVTVEGFDNRSAAAATASTTRVSDGYFATLGMSILAGRDFAVTDAADTPQVAIVNSAFVRRFNLSTQAVGRHLALGTGRTPDITIVGVVSDAKYSQVREAAPPQLFLPYRQGLVGPLTFYARVADERAAMSAIPALVARLDSNMPVERLRPLEDDVWENLTRDRVLASLSSGFAALAMLLAAVGLYGVLAYNVAQRLKEIGVRIALGATPASVRRLLLVQVARVAAIGLVPGIALALGLGRLGQALLFDLRGDSPSIIAATVALIAITIAGAALPTIRRATRVDPVVALRAE